MANKFKAGMMNFIEVLNQMWDAFVVGPFNALPLTGGSLSGPVVSTSSIRADTIGAERLYAGYYGAVPQSVIAREGAAEGEPVLSLRYVADFNRTTLGFGSSAATAINVTRNSVTGRSINTPGTINANGADYAEYLIKGLLCGTIAPGQIVGIDADGHLTDKWDLAISFAVKSTNPCMVGGDSWAAHLGPRPITPASPASPVRQDDTTDEQWADVLTGAQAAQNEFQTALAAAQVAQREFDIELEAVRQTVDRIAFAGQVPVNLQGATPGQFIVPVQDDAGIAGLAIDEADISLRQYMRAIGRVIAIEDDGRARIIVKVA